MREENREQKGRKAQKKVTGREMMEKEGRRPGWGWGYELKCYGRLGK